MGECRIRIIDDYNLLIQYITSEFYPLDNINSSDFLAYDSILYAIDKYIRKSDVNLIEIISNKKVVGKSVISDGDEVLYFGYLTLDDYHFLDSFLLELINYADEQGFSVIRGPINMPPLVFGFGILSSKSLVDIPDNSGQNDNSKNIPLELFKENKDKIWLSGCKFQNSHFSINNFEKIGFVKKFEFNLVPFNRRRMKDQYDSLKNILIKYKNRLRESFRIINTDRKFHLSEELLTDWSGMWDRSKSPLELVVSNHHVLYLPLFNSWMVFELNLRTDLGVSNEDITYRIYLEHFTTNIFHDLTVNVMEYVF